MPGAHQRAARLRQGLIWMNAVNLGWYWPAAGPQMTTYVPGPLLRSGPNEVVPLEFLCAPADGAGAPAHAMPPCRCIL